MCGGGAFEPIEDRRLATGDGGDRTGMDLKTRKGTFFLPEMTTRCSHPKLLPSFLGNAFLELLRQLITSDKPFESPFMNINIIVSEK